MNGITDRDTLSSTELVDEASDLSNVDQFTTACGGIVLIISDLVRLSNIF